ncbi:MAG: trans-4-hydroxy-L-proline dehydratase [Calditrichia bacterium]
MNERVRKLREKSLQAQPFLSGERASLLTDFYQTKEAAGNPAPVLRAKAFHYLLLHKEIFIDDGELIVGERGAAPKATPTYPELCLHSMEDLEILHSREKIPFYVAEETRQIYRDKIIPFWQGRSMREHIFTEMTPEWKDAYEAGIFTEFMEQRAPGHTVLDDKIYRNGFLNFIQRIEEKIAALDFLNDDEALEKRDQLTAMKIAAQALIDFADRYRQLALKLAAECKNNSRQRELQQIAGICGRVPAHAPQNFHEALQYYWFVHLGVITELNTWDSFNPGRLDQHLEAFYRQGLQEGSFTRESARELLQLFWIKFNNQPAPPKVGVTAKESNTYTDFCLINLGGVKADGSDAVNELSFLIMDVIEEMRLLQPSSMVQLSKKNPDSFIQRALQIVKTGFGQPSIFNTDAIVQEMIRQGKSLTDARNGGASGCVETGAFGKESYILTGYFNLPKILELTLHNGKDPLTRKQLGPETGNAADFSGMADLWNAFQKQLSHFADIKIRGSRVIERLYARRMPTPFLSLLIDDCIERGMDYHNGGARYNSSYIQGVGIGTITDSLSAIQYQVFDRKRIRMGELLKAMDHNFTGSENIRGQLQEYSPKYGNDDDYPDSIMQKVFEIFFNSIDGRPNTKGGFFRINMLPTTSHVYFGSVTGASADGRLSGTPLSEGISPVQGADRLGPTAVLKSAAKMDHLRTGGTLLNQKFSPQLLDNEAGIQKLGHLVRSYFRMDGHHIQFNVITAETLRKAQQNPQNYRDLIVRVAGYSDYFVDLTEELQNEIIARTEHQIY